MVYKWGKKWQFHSRLPSFSNFFQRRLKFLLLFDVLADERGRLLLPQRPVLSCPWDPYLIRFLCPPPRTAFRTQTLVANIHFLHVLLSEITPCRLFSLKITPCWPTCIYHPDWSMHSPIYPSHKLSHPKLSITPAVTSNDYQKRKNQFLDLNATSLRIYS